jgi:hypothetical protein
MPYLVEYSPVQSCPIIARVDHYLNSQETQKTSSASALGAGESFAFTSDGPLAGREAEAGWDTNWVDADGHGGAYWPYARDVDLAGLIKGGLAESVQRAASTNKLHNTLWVLSGPPPSGDVDAATQEQLFRVGVHENDHVVSLVIMTPEPIQASAS